MENNVVRLAVELLSGKQSFSYKDEMHDKAEAIELLRAALIEANGGSAIIDKKSLRRNKVEIFEIIEELVPIIVQDGFQGNEFFMNFVEEKNLALGDQNRFWIPDNSTFIVTKIADGVGTPDRQRLDHGRELTVVTSLHAVRMFEEFSRFMSGRIDWNVLCDKVAKAFQNAIWEDIYTAFSGISASTIGLSATYVKTGTFATATVRELIAHVEAATGMPAMLVGTKAALAHCEGAEKSDSAKESFHNAGFYGMFEGTPMVMLKQIHKKGTDVFALADDELYVIASDERFIKLVFEGDAYVDDRDTTRQSDRTFEYFMTMAWGVGIAVTGKIGKYKFTTSG